MAQSTEILSTIRNPQKQLKESEAEANAFREGWAKADQMGTPLMRASEFGVPKKSTRANPSPRGPFAQNQRKKYEEFTEGIAERAHEREYAWTKSKERTAWGSCRISLSCLLCASFKGLPKGLKGF